MDKRSDNKSDASKEADHVDVDSGRTDPDCEPVGIPEAETSASGDPGASRPEEDRSGEEPAEEGPVNEQIYCNCTGVCTEHNGRC